MNKSICIKALKGGVGKTTVAVNLADLLAKLKKSPVTLVDLDPDSKVHEFFWNNLDERYKYIRNECETVSPNLLSVGIDYLTGLAEKNKIKEELKKDPANERLFGKKLEERIEKKIWGDIDMNNYAIKANENLKIISGGTNPEVYNILEKNKNFIEKLKNLKLGGDVIYDTPPGTKAPKDLSFEVMDFADDIIIISDIDKQSQQSANKLGTHYLWYKIEKGFRNPVERKKLNKLARSLGLNILPLILPINIDNFLEVESKLNLEYHKSKDPDEKEEYKWYLEKIDKARKTMPEFKLVMNRVSDTRMYNVDGKKVPAPLASELLYEKLEESFKKKGIKLTPLAILPESEDYSEKSLIANPYTEKGKERGFVSKIFFTPKNLYEGFLEISCKIRGKNE